MYDSLTSCWKHGIKTFACCSGHLGKENAEETNYYPYIGLVLDSNSLPYGRNIVANLQDVDDVDMSVGFTQKEENWGPNEPDLYKTFRVSCCLPNRCEVFYKVYEAIERKDMDKVPFSYNDKSGNSVADFYNQIVNFVQKSPDGKEKKSGSFSYSNWSPELAQLQWRKTGWQNIKSNKIVRRFLEKIFPKEREKRLTVERYQTVAQNVYMPPVHDEFSMNYGLTGQVVERVEAEKRSPKVIAEPQAPLINDNTIEH